MSKSGARGNIINLAQMATVVGQQALRGKRIEKGYKGRTGIHELLIVDDKVRELIHNGKGEQAIEKYVRKHTPSIRRDGFDKVLAGITTLEEVLRVTRED